MSPLAVRDLCRRITRHRSAAAIVLAIGIALTIHHSTPAGGHIQHDGGFAPAVEMCLGAFVAVGTAVAAIALGFIALGQWRPSARLAPSALWSALPAPEPRARAGPALLSVLCVSRR